MFCSFRSFVMMNRTNSDPNDEPIKTNIFVSFVCSV
jgi:hypothetical protein